MKIDLSRISLAEKDIEDYLWQNPNEVAFSGGSQRLYVEQWISRQLRVPSGIIDLFGVLNNGIPAVVEVKNVPIDARALAQVTRYTRDMDDVLRTRYQDRHKRILSIVIGPSIDDQSAMEADAMRVIPITFAASLNLTLSTVHWQEEFIQRRQETIIGLSHNDQLFKSLDDRFLPKDKGDSL